LTWTGSGFGAEELRYSPHALDRPQVQAGHPRGHMQRVMISPHARSIFLQIN